MKNHVFFDDIFGQLFSLIMSSSIDEHTRNDKDKRYASNFGSNRPYVDRKDASKSAE